MASFKKNIAEISHRNPLESKDHYRMEATSPYREIERYEMPAYIARCLLYVCTAMIFVLILWSALARVDVVAVAPGQTVPRAKVRPIQPESDGVVDAILVREGEQVQANQKLLLLDLTVYKNELDQRRQDLDIAQNQLDQLAKAKTALREIIKDPASLPDSGIDVANVGTLISRLHAAYIQSQEAISDAGTGASNLSSESAQLRNQASNLSAERMTEIEIKHERASENQSRRSQNKLAVESLRKLKAASEEEIIHLESILEKTQAEEAAFKMLLAQGAVSRVEHFRIERDVSKARQELVKQKAVVAGLQKKAEIASAEQHQLAAEGLRGQAEQEGRARRILADLNQVNIQLRAAKRHNAISLGDFSAAVAAAKSALSRVETDEKQAETKLKQCQSAVDLCTHNLEVAELKAPVAGTITNITIRGRGQVVKRGDALMSVLPASSDMLIECEVGSKDIGFVEKGQKAKIKLTAFPFEDFGVVPGRVIEVAKESRNDQKLGLVYKTIIEPERQWIKARGKKITFASGMGAACEVVIRQRTVLSILLEPVKRLKETRWL